MKPKNKPSKRKKTQSFKVAQPVRQLLELILLYGILNIVTGVSIAAIAIYGLKSGVPTFPQYALLLISSIIGGYGIVGPWLGFRRAQLKGAKNLINTNELDPRVQGIADDLAGHPPQEEHANRGLQIASSPMYQIPGWMPVILILAPVICLVFIITQRTATLSSVPQSVVVFVSASLIAEAYVIVRWIVHQSHKNK